MVFYLLLTQVYNEDFLRKKIIVALVGSEGQIRHEVNKENESAKTTF